jgi:ABC-2 type transport system ATP-binding protein
MLALKVKGLNKNYDKFSLKDVSFELEKGYIMGFIGKNGAGKTTTLKSILNMIQIESGDIQIFGQNFLEHEVILKQDIGYAFSGVDFYIKKKIKQVTNTIKRFYKNWDQETYDKCLKRFSLDPEKKISELSEGMKIKYNITLALSHHAKIFILDEPTSGLDPVARDDLLELFQDLVEDGEKSILYSTHITSDLEKCADFISFIQEGKIIFTGPLVDFMEDHRLISGTKNQLSMVKDKMIAHKDGSFGFKGLIKSHHSHGLKDLTIERPSLEDIMIYYSKLEVKNDI